MSFPRDPASATALTSEGGLAYVLRAVSESYDQAATRHFNDAELLSVGESWDGAGHLIGFAAECALKHAITSLRPGQDAPHIHLPLLRDVAKKHLKQRTHRDLHTLLSCETYFEGWAVEGRYAANDSVSEEKYKSWRTDATRTLGAARLRR